MNKKLKTKTTPAGIHYEENPPQQFRDFIKVQLQKRSLTVSDTAEGFKFENDYLNGTLTLTPIVLTWKTKAGYVLLDIPFGEGKSSANFKKITDAMNFISLRLARKA